MITNLEKTEKVELRPIFARHETFHPRFGWLKKGFDKAIENKNIFSEESAPTVLGVGKNMVRAIKYWCIACRILQEETGSRNRALGPTAFGSSLLSQDGWDPYLEDLGSLWLLHWNLLKAPSQATAWHYLFNIFNRNVFLSEDIVQGLIEYKDRTFPANKIVISSLEKDISCLLRMYAEQRNEGGFKEDTIDSPFVELGLIKKYDSKHYTMNVGPKPGLAADIIVASCLDFAARFDSSAKTISITRLLYEECSPGHCFQIKENILCDAIEIVARKNNDIALSETAGLIQLSYAKQPNSLSERVLSNYYRRR